MRIQSRHIKRALITFIITGLISLEIPSPILAQQPIEERGKGGSDFVPESIRPLAPEIQESDKHTVYRQNVDEFVRGLPQEIRDYLDELRRRSPQAADALERDLYDHRGEGPVLSVRPGVSPNSHVIERGNGSFTVETIDPNTGSTQYQVYPNRSEFERAMELERLRAELRNLLLEAATLGMANNHIRELEAAITSPEMAQALIQSIQAQLNKRQGASIISVTPSGNQPNTFYITFSDGSSIYVRINPDGSLFFSEVQSPTNYPDIDIRKNPPSPEQQAWREEQRRLQAERSTREEAAMQAIRQQMTEIENIRYVYDCFQCIEFAMIAYYFLRDLGLTAYLASAEIEYIDQNGQRQTHMHAIVIIPVLTENGRTTWAIYQPQGNRFIIRWTQPEGEAPVIPANYFFVYALQWGLHGGISRIVFDGGILPTLRMPDIAEYIRVLQNAGCIRKHIEDTNPSPAMRRALEALERERKNPPAPAPAPTPTRLSQGAVQNGQQPLAGGFSLTINDKSALQALASELKLLSSVAPSATAGASPSGSSGASAGGGGGTGSSGGSGGSPAGTAVAKPGPQSGSVGTTLAAYSGQTGTGNNLVVSSSVSGDQGASSASNTVTNSSNSTPGTSPGTSPGTGPSGSSSGGMMVAVSSGGTPVDLTVNCVAEVTTTSDSISAKTTT